MTYRHNQRIQKDKAGFKRAVLWTIIISSLFALIIYLALIKIDADLRQEIEVQDRITDQRLQPKEYREN